MRFHADVLLPNPDVRHTILSVLEAALAAVDPNQAVRAVLQRDGNTLIVGTQHYDLARFRRIFVVGAGKAGAPMAQAVEAILGDRITSGLVVVKTGHGAPTYHIKVVEAAHPVPDAAGVAAGRQVLALTEQASATDLVIALLSGGGSALLVGPADGLTLADKQALTGALLACGATIHEINCLRKHCSRVKGGHLARTVAPATLITLVLSDVVGSPLDVIASGPTVPDSSTWADAWAIVEKYQLTDKVPAAIIARLQAGLAGKLAETPKPGDPVFDAVQTVVVGDNAVAAEAAGRAAQTLGWHPLLLTTYLEGEASEVAKVVVALAKQVQASGQPIPAPACLILGGETTVTLGPNPGRGGRNQALALSAALALQGTAGITVVALATDGSDGPTDSAGGLADGGTVGRGQAQGLNANDYLRRHDAYPFLQATHDLLITGPTQTNVNDLIFVFIE
ncbi:MAG: glycerate kinase [Chloroflexota bacterium]|nr:glycerate kinase [Chloroflexota bacterium]